MTFNTSILKNEEKIIYNLRALYHKYGYTQYKMSKFEEYDLYAKNKDYLSSDNIITFTDTNGKLMALKPDVTLSIVRNSRIQGCEVQKVYYNENVYRVPGAGKGFREIPQVGLECIGATDMFCISEVLLLAAKSLKYISEESRLSISNLDIVSGLINSLNLDKSSVSDIFKCISQKNVHELEAICKEKGACEEATAKLVKLIGLSGSAEEVIPGLKELGCCEESVAQLEACTAILREYGFADMVTIDFSIISDVNYYNGIVFTGYISGIPSAVVIGGQYENLMKKMGKHCGAIGFAVYLDLLERLEESSACDVDTILIYEEGADPMQLHKAVEDLTDLGITVMAQKCVPDKIRYKRLAKFSDGEVSFVGKNA